MEYEEAKKVKGRALKGYTNYVKKKWGGDGLAQCQKAIGVDIRELQDERWYPNKYAEDILKWISANHSMEHVRQAGHSVVAASGVISFAARIIGLERIMDRAFEEMRDSVNFGSVRVERDDGHAIVYFDGISAIEETCVVWVGILEGLYKLTKTKGTVTKIGCQLQGHDSCAYEMKWGK